MSNSTKRFERRRFDDERNLDVKRAGKTHSRRPARTNDERTIDDVDEKFVQDVEYFSRRWK